MTQPARSVNRAWWAFFRMRTMSSVPIKPSSLHHSIGEAFWLDARDFLKRFDALWEHGPLMHKSGRIKSCVDLMMGCECALKAHIFIGSRSEDCAAIYGRIRHAGHRIDKLVELASFMDDKAHYHRLQERLSELGVSVRYSLDADGLFFPLIPGSENTLSYSKVIGNEGWVREVRESLKALIDALQDEFTGLLGESDDMALQIELDAFIKEHVLKRNRNRR